MKRIISLFLCGCLVVSCASFKACDDVRGIDVTSEIDSLIQSSTTSANNPTSAILATVIAMLNNFAAIVTHPHDGQVVGANIAGMIAGLINIVLQGNKRGLTHPEALFELIRLNDVDREKFQELVVELATRTNGDCCS